MYNFCLTCCLFDGSHLGMLSRTGGMQPQSVGEEFLNTGEGVILKLAGFLPSRWKAKCTCEEVSIFTLEKKNGTQLALLY